MIIIIKIIFKIMLLDNSSFIKNKIIIILVLINIIIDDNIWCEYIFSAKINPLKKNIKENIKEKWNRRTCSKI